MVVGGVPRRLLLGSGQVITALAVMAAVGVGLLSATSPSLAIAALGALIAVPTAVVRPKVMAHVLVVLIYAQYITIHGVSVQRLVAPLAVIAIASELLTAPVRLVGARTTLAVVGAIGALAIASLTWTLSPSGTANGLFSLAIAIAFMGAFAVLIRTRRELRALLVTITAGAVVLALWWIVSFARGVDRAANAAGDPNFNAMILTMAIPFILVLAMGARSSAQRMWLFGAIALVAGSVITTQSRGGIASLLIMAIVVALLPARALFRSRAQKSGFFLSASLGTGVLLLLSWGSLVARIREGFTEANRGSGRGDLWLAALHAYRQHPITGIGYGAFQSVSQHLLATTSGVNLVNFLHFSRLNGQEVHSAYLGSLTEVGPLGLLLFLALLVVTARALLRAAHRAHDALDQFVFSMANASAVSLVAFAVQSAFLSTETSGRGLWMIVGFSLAIPSLLTDRGQARADSRLAATAPAGRPPIQ